MKFRILAAITLLLTSSVSSTYAQYVLRGKVIDMVSKEPLQDARLYIGDIKKIVSTNAQGNFEIFNLKPNFYVVDCSLMGYSNKALSINLQKDTNITIQLKEAVLELGEVVVTSVTRATEAKRNPIVIKSIDLSGNNNLGGSTIMDALKNVAGVDQISTGSNIAKPIIRGLGYNRIVTLKDGIRQEDQQWGSEHGVELDAYDVDKVEIVKGPGSLMYGSDAIAGVINFLSPQPSLDSQIKTQFISEYQSNNNMIGFSLANSGRIKDIDWRTRLSKKYSSNFKNPIDGAVYNSGAKELDVNLYMGVNKQWGFSHFSTSIFQTRINIPTGERDSLGRFTYEVPFNNDSLVNQVASGSDLKGYRKGIPFQNIQHIRFASNNNLNLKQGNLNFNLAYQNNQRIEHSNVLEPNTKEIYLKLHTINYATYYNLRSINNWKTSLGLSGMYQINQNHGEEYLIPDYSLFDIGTFITTQKTFKKLTIAAGIRKDIRYYQVAPLYLDSLGQKPTINSTMVHLKFNAIDKYFKGLSGSIGLAFIASKYSNFKLNLSSGYRAPNIAEISTNGYHEGAYRYELGSSNLLSEFNQQIDFAYSYTSEHIGVAFTPFINFVHNYIYLEKLMSKNGTDSVMGNNMYPVFQYTQSNATLSGAELFIDIHPHPLDWLHVANSFSIVQGVRNNNTTDSTKYLPMIPAAKHRLEVKAELEPFSKYITSSFVKLAIDNYFKKEHVYTAYQTETVTPAYSLLSISAGFTTKLGKSKQFLNIYLQADNITNKAYQSHLSRLKYAPNNIYTGNRGIYNMGRNVSIKMIFNF